MEIKDFCFTPHELGPSSKTYGYIQTLHIVDEEDLPANPEDFLKKHLNSNTNVLTRDYVLKQKNQVRHQPPQLAVPRDEFTSDGDVGDVDDRAAIQTNEIKDQGEEDPDTGKICVDKVMFSPDGQLVLVAGFKQELVLVFSVSDLEWRAKIEAGAGGLTGNMSH